MRSMETLTVVLRESRQRQPLRYSLGPDQIRSTESTKPEDESEATVFFPTCQKILHERERYILDVYSSIPPA